MGVWIKVIPDCVLGVASRLGLALPCVGVAPLPVPFAFDGPFFPLGLAGKVENGPSWTLRLLGGRPRSFPDAVLVVDGHALETAGPWRRRVREGDLLAFVVDGCADLGSSKEGELEKVCRGVIADWGYGEDGVSLLVKRQRIGWTTCAFS